MDLIKSKEIKIVPIKSVKFYSRNRNKHTKEQIQRLKKLLEYQGMRVPLIVDQETNEVIAGNGRLEAMQKMKWKEIPVIYQSFDSEEQRYAFSVSDNAVAGWAELDFSGINLDIGDFGPDFDLELLGLKDFTVDVADKEAFCEEDEVPDSAPAITKVGDLYILGEHRLLCGDSTNIQSVERLMDGKKADMVFTDPPYNTGMTAETQRGTGGLWKGRTNGKARLSHMFHDDFTDEEWQSLLQGFISSMFCSMKEDSTAYICLDWRRSHELVPILKSCFKFSNLIIWDKIVHGLGSDYKYTHEFIHVVKKGKPELNTHQGDQEYQDVWHIQRKMGRDEDHATKKPIEIIERAINHASKSGQIVLDLFNGSGSTLIACEKTNRKAALMELSPKYCDIAIARWEKYTGKKAELSASYEA